MEDELSYTGAIEYLYSLQKHGTKLGLSNTYALLGLLGNPHERFRSIHIAGTNGKGSTAAMLASILKRQGYSTGLYTSPHLISFTERIRINGMMIPEERVVELTCRLRGLIATLPEPFVPTFFEFTTAIAFAHFAESGIDVAVVETGMGGRLDSTNVITPLVSVITPVDMDHQEFLGDTIEAIAFEKAGIIKQGVPVVAGVHRVEALEVIDRVAREREAATYLTGRDCMADEVSVDAQGCTFAYRGPAGRLPDLAVPLAGRHQVDNACTALLTVDVLRRQGLSISTEAVREGLLSTSWAGRIETVAKNPRIILDGAHNQASAARLADALKELFLGSHERLILILGILGDKDMEGIMQPLVPLADRVIVTQPAYYRAASTDVMRKAAERCNPRVEEAPSVSEAIEAAKRLATERDLICVTGSLFTVGEARGLFPDDAFRTQKGHALSGFAELKG